MHLTLIISSLNPGGAERVLSGLANYWSSQGHQVSLVTLDSPKFQPFYPLDPKIHLIQLGQRSSASSLFTRLKNIVRRIFCVRKTIQKLNPDVVISFVDITNIITLLATIGSKIPVVISERIDPHFYVIPKLYTWLRFKIYPLCAKLIVQTEAATRYFPQGFKEFIQIIPNPVSEPKLTKETPSEKASNIVTVGRLEPQKDHITLLQAFSHLLKTRPELTLTIYGEGKERQNLEALISSLNLQAKIFLPGTTKNIQDALIAADLFIFPSRYEGFPNALCEAMAVGLPVIASNCSGNVDIVRDGIDGRLFPVGDVEALTRVTLELLDDPFQRARLSEQAKEICTRFHPDRIFALWDHVLAKKA